MNAPGHFVILFSFLSVVKIDAAPTADRGAMDFFEKSVRPVLVQRCYECHSVSAGKRKGGLLLDSRAATLKGGDSGPALMAGDVEKSLLIESIRYKNEELQMPPKGALPPAEIKVLEEWVRMGAPDPRNEAAPAKGHAALRVIDLAAGAKHWAFRPLAHPTVPETDAVNPIDAFILDRLRSKGLTLSSPADARTLIRRITFDLTGLPPTPAEVAAFTQAYAADEEGSLRRLIDQLLASPHYGEKWGRHWLDVARYSDSNGLDENVALGTAWRYRDYVVRSFNADKPFDRFLTEQLAGDLLPFKNIQERRENVTATAFLNLGAKVLAEPDKAKLVMDVIDEQIDVTGRAFMGMTLGCVRCHDHKFDPVPQEDYYALAAIFKSTRSFDTEQRGSLYFAYEAPVGSLDDFAAVKSAEHGLSRQKTALKQAVAAADAALRREARAHAVEYLMAAAELPAAPTLSQARPIASQHKLRAHILLNCRIYLAANEKLPFFKPWQQAVHAEKSAASLKGYYTAIFAACEKIKLPPKGKPHPDSLLHQARAALDNTQGFLALPPEPSVLYPPETNARITKMRDELRVAESNLPDLPTTLAVSDGAKIFHTLPIHIRGSHLALGKPVKRGVLQVIDAALPKRPTFPADHSGRLELARWLTNPEHPLTSRVIVNRIWSWHFNQGIVPTTDNFGLLGMRPTHPELLDWLARWFSASHWSIKDLHRLIMTSRVYRQSSAAPNAQAAASDPENLLLHHFPVRRLEAEEIRDTLLRTAGLLNTTIGGKTIPLRDREFVFNHTSKDFTAYDSTRRALYLPVIRNNLYNLFQQFDYPDPATSTGLRGSSVVSPQALLFMNSDLATRAARGFARYLSTISSDTPTRIRAAYNLAYAREATDEDLRRCQDYLITSSATLSSSRQHAATAKDESWTLLCQALLMSNEFIYLR